jgi:hypothetical protein
LFPPLLLVAACGAAPEAPAALDDSRVAPTVAIVVDGVLWELPGAACGAPADELAAAAEAAAREVERLVAARASGWPTTTAATAGTEASFFVAVNRAGPQALALGILAGTATEIATGWTAFETGYGGEAWGPIDAISIRLAGWEATAAAIAAALPAACG